MPATTIPENPKPGERFMKQGVGGWRVYLFHDGDGYDHLIARGLSEVDARLLVFGGAAVATLRELQDAYEDGTPQCFCSNSNLDFAPGPCTPCKVRAALSNFPEVSGGGEG